MPICVNNPTLSHLLISASDLNIRGTLDVDMDSLRHTKKERRKNKDVRILLLSFEIQNSSGLMKKETKTKEPF